MDEEITEAEMQYILHGNKTECDRCCGEGWLPAIGPYPDGSYITTRECPTCRGTGKVSAPNNPA